MTDAPHTIDTPHSWHHRRTSYLTPETHLIPDTTDTPHTWHQTYLIPDTTDAPYTWHQRRTSHYRHTSYLTPQTHLIPNTTDTLYTWHHSHTSRHSLTSHHSLTSYLTPQSHLTPDTTASPHLAPQLVLHLSPVRLWTIITGLHCHAHTSTVVQSVLTFAFVNLWVLARIIHSGARH